MDDEELFLAGVASGLDLPTAAAMSADDGDDDRSGGENKQTGCGCLTVLLFVALIGTLAGLLIA